MNHDGTMMGMLFAGVLMSLPPLVLGTVIGVAVVRRWRAERAGRAG